MKNKSRYSTDKPWSEPTQKLSSKQVNVIKLFSQLILGKDKFKEYQCLDIYSIGIIALSKIDQPKRATCSDSEFCRTKIGIMISYLKNQVSGV